MEAGSDYFVEFVSQDPSPERRERMVEEMRQELGEAVSEGTPIERKHAGPDPYAVASLAVGTVGALLSAVQLWMKLSDDNRIGLGKTSEGLLFIEPHSREQVEAVGGTVIGNVEGDLNLIALSPQQVMDLQAANGREEE